MNNGDFFTDKNIAGEDIIRPFCKTVVGGETPHQSPSVTASPQGEAFLIKR